MPRLPLGCPGTTRKVTFPTNVKDTLMETLNPRAQGILARLWNTLVKPTVRLEPNFPWRLGKSMKTYGVALIYYFLGSFASAFLVMAGVFLLALHNPDFARAALEKYMAPFMVAVTVISFLSGFGLELWYLNRALQKDKLSLRKLCGLNLDSLGGSIWAAIWRGFLTWGFIVVADRLVQLIPMPAAHDPAAEFLQSLAGWPLYVMVLLVVSGVIFEEIIFRGFLFNMIRSSLWKTGASGNFRADVIAIAVSASAFALMHFNLSGFLSYFVAGAILAESYRRSGSLYVPIMAHFLNNLTAVIIVLHAMMS